ncbi:MAG: gamma-glutamyltransferase [Planctomycetes bacterium]|nr:gamma-glutamyltransferase [Planctomycetota bacterium]
MAPPIERVSGWFRAAIAVLAFLPATRVACGADGTAPAAEVIGARALESRHGMVACVERRAAEIGAAVLASGGNAVDAAVAVGFALAVTWPEAGNLGGGGFMLVALADGASVAIDYREVAPRRMTADHFLAADGAVDQPRREFGHHGVGVPGTVAGLAEAHRRFGTRPWAELVAPARALAADGIVVQPALASGLAEHAIDLARFPATKAQFLREDGHPPEPGETLVQADLANSLRWIEEGGAAAFYDGPIAALLAAEMERAGALLDARDLAAYRAVVRAPLAVRHRGHELLLMPPPSSGGVALAQMLALLAPFELGARGAFDAGARHLFAEASRRAFADRAQWLGDPDAVAVPVAELLGEEHIAARRASIDPARAGSSDAFGPPVVPAAAEGGSTTHFSIVDAMGNAVANTYTLEERFGSKLIAPGTGFLLNNELQDFNPQPGRTTRDGQIGTAANLARGARRPLSSMTPCIVRRDGEVVLVTGSPGGRTIISTVTQIVLDVLEFGTPLAEAVARPRQHHAWFPDRVAVERAFDAATVAELRALGHEVVVSTRSTQGDAHSIARGGADGTFAGVADQRIDGWCAAPSAPPVADARAGESDAATTDEN